MGKGRCPVILTSPKDAGFQPPDWTLPGRDAPCGGVAVGAACQPVGAGATGLLLLACEVGNPAQSCGGGWKPDGAGEQHYRVVDLFGRRSCLYRPPGMAVDRSFRTNRRRCRQLDQVGCFFVQRSLFPDCFTKILQGLKGLSILLPHFAVPIREISVHAIASLTFRNSSVDVAQILTRPTVRLLLFERFRAAAF